MGRVTFHTRPDKSHLVIVDTESKAEAMLILTDLDAKPFPVSPDTQPNTHTSLRLNLTFLHPVSAKTVGDLDIHQNSVDPLHITIFVPHLTIPVQIPFFFLAYQASVQVRGCLLYRAPSLYRLRLTHVGKKV